MDSNGTWWDISSRFVTMTTQEAGINMRNLIVLNEQDYVETVCSILGITLIGQDKKDYTMLANKIRDITYKAYELFNTNQSLHEIPLILVALLKNCDYSLKYNLNSGVGLENIVEMINETPQSILRYQNSLEYFVSRDTDGCILVLLWALAPDLFPPMKSWIPKTCSFFNRPTNDKLKFYPGFTQRLNPPGPGYEIHLQTPFSCAVLCRLPLSLLYHFHYEKVYSRGPACSFAYNSRHVQWLHIPATSFDSSQGGEIMKIQRDLGESLVVEMIKRGESDIIGAKRNRLIDHDVAMPTDSKHWRTSMRGLVDKARGGYIIRTASNYLYQESPNILKLNLNRWDSDTAEAWVSLNFSVIGGIVLPSNKLHGPLVLDLNVEIDLITVESLVADKV